MKNYDLIEEFLSRTTERYWDEAMLEDKNYLVPKDKICDYVRSIIRIPYRDFLSYLRDNPSTESIESKNITQCSSFVACERDMCKILERENNPGFSYEQIGQLLKDKTGSNTLDAYKKYGENQIKTSQQLGLAFEYFGDWYLSSIGYVYLMLSPTEQHSLLARTLLRDCLYAQIIKDLSTTNVDLLSYMECISSDSTKARRYGCVEFLVKMCIEECNREGTNIYSIKPRTSFQKKKDEWIVKSYSHYLPIATKINENLPIHLSRRAHIPISNDGSYKDKYISLITSVPLLTESEEKNLFLQYKGGDESAYHAICEAHLPIIFDIACKFKEISPNIDIQDLVGEGVFALCKAIELFNPTYSTRLISYAMHGIKQRMQECVDTYSSFVHLPTTQIIYLRKIQTAYDRFEQEHERRPSVEELACVLNEPVDRVADTLKMSGESVSLEGYEDLICAENEDSLFYNLHRESLIYEINRALKQLTPREADILRKYYGIGYPEKTLEEIGIEFNLTRERVRQICEKASRKLKTSSRSGILRTYLGEDLFSIDTTISKQRKQCENNDYNIEQPKRTGEYLTPNIETPVVTNVIKKEYLVKNRKLFYAYPSDELRAFANWARREGTIVNGINYKLFPTEKVASVILKVEGSIEGSLIIPNKIKVDEDEYVVSYVGTRAFYYNSELSFVVIPRTVTIIRNNAFEGCSSLKKISLPDSLDTIGENAFLNCESLGSISLPDSVMTIGTHAFKGCSSLTIVSLPEKLRTLTLGMFTGCVSLSSIRLSYELDKIESYVFYKCHSLKTITIPQRIKQICHHTFDSCYYLEEVQLPDRLFEIEYNAFYECRSLKSINLPDSLIKIGAHAFEGCSSIETIKIPSSLNSIGKQAFANCSNLKSITLSNNIVKIGRRVFDRCNSLERIVVPKDKKEYYCKLGLEQYRNLIYEV